MVLRDKKRRERYDIIGLDLDENDASQTDASSNSLNEEESKGEDEFMPKTLSKDSEAVREVILDFAVTFLRSCMTFILTQYTIGALLALIGQAGYAYTKRNTKGNELFDIALFCVVLCVLYWSTAEGWLFWIVSSLILWGDLFKGGTFLIGTSFVYPGQAILGVLSLFLTWWFHGSIFRYFMFLVLIVVCYVLVFFFFLVAGFVIEHTVKEKLKEIAPKIRGEVSRLRIKLASLRSTIRTLRQQQNSGGGMRNRKKVDNGDDLDGLD